MIYKKVLGACMVAIVTIGCVETDSSVRDYQSDSSASTTSSTSDASSSLSSMSTSSSSGASSSVSSLDTIFDANEAIEDPNACMASGLFNALIDSSFDPLGTADEPNGVEISSRMAYNAKVEMTQVILYYPDLTQTLQSTFVNQSETLYRFTYNAAWLYNVPKTVYVRTPQDSNGKYSCYRYEINSAVDNSLTKTKVYRLN